MTVNRRWLEHRRRAAGYALVLALHAVLWWGLAQALRPAVPAPVGDAARTADAANAPVVLWLLPPPPAQTATRAEAAPAALAERATAAATERRAQAVPLVRQSTRPVDAPLGAITLPEVPPPRAGAPVVLAPLPATAPSLAAAPTEVLSAPPAPSAPSPPPLNTGSLLDTPASRRVLREAARQPTLAERAAQASGEPARLSTEQRLGREIEQAAIGDCLKGEFFGAGAGLFSLPFLVAAELRGHCRR